MNLCVDLMCAIDLNYLSTKHPVILVFFLFSQCIALGCCVQLLSDWQSDMTLMCNAYYMKQ